MALTGDDLTDPFPVGEHRGGGFDRFRGACGEGPLDGSVIGQELEGPLFEQEELEHHVRGRGGRRPLHVARDDPTLVHPQRATTSVALDVEPTGLGGCPQQLEHIRYRKRVDCSLQCHGAFS